MEWALDSVFLSRLQFALTAIFHILWPVLTIGLSAFLVIAEALWLKTRDPAYYHHARFWARLLLLNFGVGVVSGLPLEFEFGTNWAPFSTAMGDFFGNILGFEGAMAFMLEAGFLGIMMFGWKRVAPGIHLFATIMVALGASLSAFWIMVANSWMQTPAGGQFVDGHFVVTSYFDAIFNPDMPWGTSHMWVACLETSLFVVGGLSAWYVLRNREPVFFAKSLRIAVAAAVLIAPLQVFLGDGSGVAVFAHQPAKGAAIEGHWNTNPPGQGAPWAVLAWPNRDAQRNDWALEIPNLLSLLATHSLDGRVLGLRAFPRKDQPPALPLLFYSFRVMVAIGFYFVGLMLWSLWVWWRRGLSADSLRPRRWLLRAWVAAIPMGYVAVEAGWIVREVGRQPWIVYGVLRTSAAASQLPASTVLASLLGFAAIYATLLIVTLRFAARILRRGPDLSLPPPEPPGTAGDAEHSALGLTPRRGET
ncbi:MAG: cytochrome ubiquinol oxidase subunit I [Chromatiales bacterium 21-64-14]|nr:MAG: cytochrome ubiquinol oxidase subunit I [Chromatiales bacterium 21-64-14]HQU15119.1 cytochrome ubiquinol oxidase subunit I [Gammaproteobacteria bacterium]